MKMRVASRRIRSDSCHARESVSGPDIVSMADGLELRLIPYGGEVLSKGAGFQPKGHQFFIDSVFISETLGACCSKANLP